MIEVNNIQIHKSGHFQFGMSFETEDKKNESILYFFPMIFKILMSKSPASHNLRIQKRQFRFFFFFNKISMIHFLVNIQK